VRGIGHGVHHGEEALGQFVGFTFTGLVGLDRDQRVMPALLLDAYPDLPHGSGEPATALGLIGRGQPWAEERGRPRHDLIGG
jgi:hypothetical protein